MTTNNKPYHCKVCGSGSGHRVCNNCLDSVIKECGELMRLWVGLHGALVPTRRGSMVSIGGGRGRTQLSLGLRVYVMALIQDIVRELSAWANLARAHSGVRPISTQQRLGRQLSE